MMRADFFVRTTLVMKGECRLVNEDEVRSKDQNRSNRTSKVDPLKPLPGPVFEDPTASASFPALRQPRPTNPITAVFQSLVR